MSYCEICGLGDLGREVHNSVIHALADRIAKLEARLDRGGWPVYDAIEPTAASGPIPPGYKLAPGWVPMFSGAKECIHAGADGEYDCISSPLWETEMGAGDRAGVACAAHAFEMRALVKVEPPVTEGRCRICDWPYSVNGCHPDDCSYRPAAGTPEAKRIEMRRDVLGADRLHPVEPPAEQPASAVGEVQWACGCGYTNAGPVCTKCGKPPAPSQVLCNNESFCPVITDHPSGACPAHRFSLPAPAHGAPAEPLSARLAPWVDGRLSVETLDVRSLHEKVAALEARLAAAERERSHFRSLWLAVDEAMKQAILEREVAVAAERERCWAFIKPMNRQVILDLMVKYPQGSPESRACSELYALMHTAEEAIRDGRQAPK